MSTCLNCKATLSCGCQKRVAVDGAQVCTNCQTGYNQRLATSNKPLVVKTNLASTAPTDVRVAYRPKK